jgi:hypothetical protein
MKLFRQRVGVRPLALAVFALGLISLGNGGTTAAQVSIGISVNFAPPELPVYEQPLCPGEGYLWTPGYWAWDPDFGDYYWVPGTWVLAPQPGYLWTPPYWGWSGAAFVFHEGYWGPRVGFYGGINYGYGYTGRGYYGGRWERDRFYYNRNVNNINVTQIHNVYSRTVVNNVDVTRVSYNGGTGGIRESANRQEQEAARERHVGAVAVQQQHVQEARTDRALRASDNHGKPPIAATDRPGQFRGGNVVPAKVGKYNPPPNRGEGGNGRRPDTNRVENNRPENRADSHPNNRPNERPDSRVDNRPERNDRPPNARGPESNSTRPTYVHPNEAPKANRPDRPPSSGNAKADQKYQQRTDNMYRKQEQERQNLQKQQDQQHARAEQQKAGDAHRQQMEKQHQQQTQKMEQRQQQQQQKMERQAPKPKAQPQPKQQPPQQQQPKQQGGQHEKQP